MDTINAQATRAERGWVATFKADGERFHIRTKHFAQLAEAIAATCAEAGIEIGTIAIASIYEDAKRGADHATAEAEAAARTAQEIRRSLVRKMKHDGLTHADIAAILGISHQRVSQLITGNATREH